MQSDGCKLSVKLGLRSVILQCNSVFFGSLWARRCAVCVVDIMKCDSTLLSKSPYLLPLLLKFILRFITSPTSLWCLELTIILNAFTVCNVWLRQYRQTLLYGSLRVGFPYLWKLWNIFFIPSTFCWKYLMEKGPKSMAFHPPSPPPQTKPRVKTGACTWKAATV
jgi:hypothetical protein